VGEIKRVGVRDGNGVAVGGKVGVGKGVRLGVGVRVIVGVKVMLGTSVAVSVSVGRGPATSVGGERNSVIMSCSRQAERNRKTAPRAA
jgi:acetyltransferase-like isoleucine patch superfamily enzyme